MLEVGRICMKIAGREAGKYCVVVKKMDESFVMVTGPKELTSVKRRRCNVNHLEPLLDVVKIKSDAPDSDVLKAYQEASLTRKLGLESGKGVRKAEPKVPKPPKYEKPETRKAPAKKTKPKKTATKKAKTKKPEARKKRPVKKAKAAPRKAVKKPAAKPKKAAKKAVKKK